MSEDINWKVCIIFQTETTESLRCPSNAHGTNAENILTVNTDFINNDKRLGLAVGQDGLPFSPDMTAECLRDHNNVWHSTCKKTYDKDKVYIMIKKKERQNDNDRNDVRKSSKRQVVSIKECIFCEKDSTEGNQRSCRSIHQVTFNV